MPRLSLITLPALLCAAATATVSAAPVDWNTWTSSSAGTLNTGGTSVTVTYDSADVHSVVADYPSWTPAGSFADGIAVDNGPVAGNGIMRINGGSPGVNTLTFSSAVVNPVLAIWSLGAGGRTATFDFINATPVFVSGGSNSEYGGSSIQVAGSVVSGNEGNGTIGFAGSYTTLTWTNPTFESWYGFNVGVASAVPEPGMAAMLLVGLLPLAWRVRRS
jgi:hypothetical protein